MQPHKKYLNGREKRESERKRKMPDNSPLLLILYLIGITGIIITLNSLIMMDMPRLALTIVSSAAFNGVLWYIFIYKNRFFNTITISACFLAVLYCIIDFRRIQYSLASINSGTIPSSAAPFIIILAALFLLLSFILEFSSRNHSLIFLLCSALLILGPLINIKMTPVPTVMIVVFQFGFIVVNPAGNSPKKNLTTKRSARTAAISCITAAALLLGSFAPAFLIEKQYRYDILSQIYQVDGKLQDMMAKMSDNFDSGISEGLISRGNLRQTGAEMFTAEIVNPPEERLYLKSFTGSAYNGEFWESALWGISDDSSAVNYYCELVYDPDTRYNELGFYREPFINDLIRKAKTDYFSQVNKIVKKATDNVLSIAKAQYFPTEKKVNAIAENGDNFTIRSDGIIFYGASYYTGEPLPPFPEQLFISSARTDPVTDIFTWDVNGESTTSGKGNTINITPENGSITHNLAPYYSTHSDSENEELPWEENIGYSFYNYYKYQSTLEDAYMDKTAEEALAPYSTFLNDYYEECLGEYTDVPYQKLPRLTKLCGETDLTDVDEITTFILYTLQNNADYSTTPGTVPYNRDTIEYFLFDNHKGYCVHFATAAVLMYRLFGIPARYASGYVIDQSLFTENGKAYSDTPNAADYHYQATVTDRCAHAWAEIFLNGYGWVPVEVTPTTDGTMIASYPGYDPVEMNRIMQKHNWKFRSSGTFSNTAGNRTGAGTNSFSFGDALFIFLCAAAAAVLIFFPVRRAVILRREKDMPCPRLYGRLIRCLHFCRKLKEYNGSEQDFAQALSEALPAISPEDAERLVSVLQSVHYSPDPITEEDREFVYKTCRMALDELYSITPWYKKAIFRFIKAYK